MHMRTHTLHAHTYTCTHTMQAHACTHTHAHIHTTHVHAHTHTCYTQRTHTHAHPHTYNACTCNTHTQWTHRHTQRAHAYTTHVHTYTYIVYRDNSVLHYITCMHTCTHAIQVIVPYLSIPTTYLPKWSYFYDNPDSQTWHSSGGGERRAGSQYLDAYTNLYIDSYKL